MNGRRSVASSPWSVVSGQWLMVLGLGIRVAMQSVPQRGSVWLGDGQPNGATRYRVVVLTASPRGWQDP